MVRVAWSVDSSCLSILTPFTQGEKKLVGRAEIDPGSSCSASNLFNHWTMAPSNAPSKLFLVLKQKSFFLFLSLSARLDFVQI